MHRRDFIDLGVRLAAANAVWPALASRHATAPLAAPRLDAHVHPRSPALIRFRERSAPPRGDTAVDGAELVRRLDADGVAQAYVLSTAYQMAADVGGAGTAEPDEQQRVQAENDFTAAECARFPDRLIPFLSVNPKRPYAIDEIDRCVDVHHMRGLKLHLWNSLVDTRQSAQIAQLRRVVTHAAGRGLPVVAHIYVGAIADYGADDTERFVREIIAPVESLRICVAHVAGAGGFAAPVPACFERLVEQCGPASALARRTWIDVAAILTRPVAEPDRRRLGGLLERWGLDRVLWGSDSIADALATTTAQWPLDAAAWSLVARHGGDALVGR